MKALKSDVEKVFDAVKYQNYTIAQLRDMSKLGKAKAAANEWKNR